MAQQTNNTMIEELPKLGKVIWDMKQLPDADMPFLISLENMILGYIKSKQQGINQNAQNPAPPPMPPGMGGLPMASGMGMPGGSPMSSGMTAGAQAPGPDDLARLLGAGAPGLQ